MTVTVALEMIRRAGSVMDAGGSLKLTFPKSMRTELLPAIETLKTRKAEALAQLAQSDSVELPPIEESLKGRAVELWRDGNRFFLVADDEDAQEAMGRFGASRGEIWTRAELELVARFRDQAIRDEIETFKRKLDGALSRGSIGKPGRTTPAVFQGMLPHGKLAGLEVPNTDVA
jgi:hypothetical protein